jgi:hypothetical protein
MAGDVGSLALTFAQRQASFQTVLITRGVRRPELLATVSSGRKSAGE